MCTAAAALATWRNDSYKLNVDGKMVRRKAKFSGFPPSRTPSLKLAFQLCFKNSIPFTLRKNQVWGLMK